MVNDRFILLLTNELCDQLTDAEREELNALLQENQEYRDQREVLKEYWEKDKGEYETNTAMFKKVLEKIKTEHPDQRDANPEETDDAHPNIPLTEPTPLRRISRFAWYSVAAAVLLAIGGTTYFFRSSTTHNNRESIARHWLQKTTHPTKKDQLTLSDGTVVTLNSATTIKYPDHFSDSTREVYLEGEAYFDVSKDPLHPFIIHTDKMNIRVLGTSFNVKSYQSEPLGEASLINGSIEVTLTDRPSDRIILKPKEKLIVQDNGTMKKTVNPDPSTPGTAAHKTTRFSLTSLTYFHNTAATVVETSWVENKLVFSEKDFIDLSGQLERWYGVHIQFANERVKHYNFTGFFEKETLPEALDALKMIEQFNYKITDSTVYIY
ncbi:MAG TPA: FecR family protein [Puia sp.]|jgi:ferric-dicitrate binding protein FerR (iron transport regulator)